MLINKCLRCNYFPEWLLFLLNLQTFTLRWKLFSVLIFMRQEMFSEETAQFSKIALSTTVLSLRELFRRIKTTSRKFSVCKCMPSFMQRSFVKPQRLESYKNTRQNTQNLAFFSILYSLFSICRHFDFRPIYIYRKVFSIRHNSLSDNIR